VDPAAATPDRDLEITTNLGTIHDLQETDTKIEGTQLGLDPDLPVPVAMMMITRGQAADVVAVTETAPPLGAIQTITLEGTAAEVDVRLIAVGVPHRKSMFATGTEVGDALLSNSIN
jgi:hypothetical protein